MVVYGCWMKQQQGTVATWVRQTWYAHASDDVFFFSFWKCFLSSTLMSSSSFVVLPLQGCTINIASPYETIIGKHHIFNYIISNPLANVSLSRVSKSWEFVFENWRWGQQQERNSIFTLFLMCTPAPLSGIDIIMCVGAIRFLCDLWPHFAMWQISWRVCSLPHSFTVLELLRMSV